GGAADPLAPANGCAGWPECTGCNSIHCAGGAFKHLIPGRRYVVIKPFHDYDQSLHAEGESWTYLGYSFLPYEDGLTLFISSSNPGQSSIRLQWARESQGEIVDNLEHYVRADAHA